MPKWMTLSEVNDTLSEVNDTLSEVVSTVGSDIYALLCSWDAQTGNVAWRMHSSPLGAVLTWREGNWIQLIQIWSTPRFPSLSCSCVDLVASLLSSDLVSLIAWSTCKPFVHSQSFAWSFPNFSSLYRSYSSSQWGSRRQDVTSFLPFLPFSVLWAFSFKCLYFSSGFQSCAWFLKLIKAVSPTMAERC